MTSIVARILGRPLERRDAFAQLGAIVVLGSPLRMDGSLSPVLAERIRAGVSLWNRGGAPLLLMSGGRNLRARHEGTEADAMAAEAVRLGVPTEAVLVERASRYTMENAVNSAPMLRAAGVSSVWVVTTPFHLRRAVGWFARLGFVARGWRIDDSVQDRDPRRALRWCVKEYGALLRDRLTPL